MEGKKLNLLNAGLILLALVLAFVLPFRLFLYSYAILGPLHYLTEINWLHSRKYMIPDLKWLWVGVVAVLVIILPQFIFLSDPPAGSTLEKAMSWMFGISNGALFIPLAISAIMVFIQHKWIRITLILLSLGLAFLLNSIPTYLTIVGLLLPTLVHVYLFTLLFMLFGAIKGKDRSGYIPIAFMIIAPLVIIGIEVDASKYLFPDHVKEVFVANNFHNTVAQVGKLLGVMDGTTFYFYERIELKIQTFIAFAYLYHYLNWFTKTSIIGWHSELKGKRAIAVITLWFAMIGLFAYDYQLGFVFALGFSFLHVILEFPLNASSIKGIIQKLLPV